MHPTSSIEAVLCAVLAGILLALTTFWAPAWSATDVWVFYGAGPNFLSAGMDVIARRATTLSGVGVVHGPYNYWETQRTHDEMVASQRAGNKTVVVGYSCGGNATLAVAQSGIPMYALAIQPSLWCGRYQTTANIIYAQDTYGNCVQTWGLGCYQFRGAAQKTVNIYRPDLHLQADDDPNSQNDVLSAIYAIANPGRAGVAIRHLHRTAVITRYNGQSGVWHLRAR